MSVEDFTALVDNIPLLKIMTISPHVDAMNNYDKIRALIKR